MKVIAHGINNLKLAQKAVKSGVDFVEIDVSKRILFHKFTAQHNGLKGLFGIGTLLENMLNANLSKYAFLDLKPNISRSFAEKLSILLNKLNITEAKICGNRWKLISLLSKTNNARPFYTLKDKKSIGKFKKLLPSLKKPAGFSVKHNLIDEQFMKDFKKKSFEIWAWTVNDTQDAKRLMALGVDGIITDNWESALKLR